MRAFVLLLVLLAGVSVAQTPPATPPENKPIPTTDKEKLDIRAAQVEILGLLQQRKQLKDQFDAQDAELMKQLQAAQPVLDKALAEAKAAHQCNDCGFDKDLNLQPPIKSPTPAPAAPAPK